MFSGRSIIALWLLLTSCLTQHRKLSVWLYTEMVCLPKMVIHPTTNTHPFNGPFSGTTRVSRYQKGNTNLDFCEARDSEWQWHQLGHMQVYISLQTDNHASTPLLSFFTGRMPFLPPNQQRQSTEGTTNRNHNTQCTQYYYHHTTDPYQWPGLMFSSTAQLLRKGVAP